MNFHKYSKKSVKRELKRSFFVLQPRKLLIFNAKHFEFRKIYLSLPPRLKTLEKLD